MGCCRTYAWVAWYSLFAGLTLFVVIGIPLLIFLGGSGGIKDPAFTVESGVVKAYNLTSDNRLFCIFQFSVRAHNRDPKHSVKYTELNLEVRKGKHHKLADDFVTPFRQAVGNDTVMAVEAVGLYVQLKDGIAGEMRADRAAGATTVSIFFAGSLGSRDNIEIRCGNVKVFFDGEGGEFDKVGCNVNVYDPNNSNAP